MLLRAAITHIFSLVANNLHLSSLPSINSNSQNNKAMIMIQSVCCQHTIFHLIDREPVIEQVCERVSD